MTPNYIESPPAAEQLPFLFWLSDALRPRVIVDFAATDATAYFGLCQAAGALSLDTHCYLGGLSIDIGRGPANAKVQRWIKHQKAHYGAHSQIVGGSANNVMEMLQAKSLDLLVLHAEGASSDLLQEWVSAFVPKLSPRSAIFVDGLGNRADDFFDGLMKEGLGFRFQHGSGFGVVATGSSPPELIRYLEAQAKDDTNAEVARALFQRLGLGCRHAFDQKFIGDLHGQMRSAKEEISGLREELGLKSARVVGRESEIFELRDRLDWHREQLAKVQQKSLSAEMAIHKLRQLEESANAYKESKQALESASEQVRMLEADTTRMRRELRGAQSALINSSENEKRIRLVSSATKRRAQKLEKEKRALRKEVLRLQKALEMLCQSRSWRLTAPLRKLMARLRG